MRLRSGGHVRILHIPYTSASHASPARPATLSNTPSARAMAASGRRVYILSSSTCPPGGPSEHIGRRAERPYSILRIEREWATGRNNASAGAVVPTEPAVLSAPAPPGKTRWVQRAGAGATQSLFAAFSRESREYLALRPEAPCYSAPSGKGSPSRRTCSA